MCFFILFLDNPINNERYVCLHFEVKESYVLHGFAGYFDTLLYDDLTLSKLIFLHTGRSFKCKTDVKASIINNLGIVPKTHSFGMISWFPIYFPIKVWLCN